MGRCVDQRSIYIYPLRSPSAAISISIYFQSFQSFEVWQVKKVGLVEWWNDAHDSVQVHASSIERVWQNRTPYVCLSA